MAIYLRDDFDCVYCRMVFPLDGKGLNLTIDHIEPDGGNDPENLVTACPACNTAKNSKPFAEWLKDCARRGWNAKSIRQRVRIQTAKPLERTAGRLLAQLRCPNYKA